MVLHKQPSFSLLFRRSKYGSYAPREDEGIEESQKEREEKRRETEQKERYLATAIGFCIRYDSTFRSHFLEAICDLPKKLAKTPIDVRVEEQKWGDLVLNSRREDFACVVECKLHAKLQPWQNPAAEGFEREGYGKLILDEFQRTQKIIQYTVLGWEESLTFPQGTRIGYGQKSWSDLERKFPRHRPLAADLYECLSALGVPAFMFKKTQTIKLGNNTEFLAQALTLFPAAQIEAGLDETWSKFDCWAEPSYWCFGVTVKRTEKTKTARGRLQEFVKPEKGRAIAWYGYENALLSFWFHCANAKAQKNVEDRLLQNGINPAYIKPGDAKDSFYVIIRAPLDAPTKEGLDGDRSWFSKVLKAAMNNK
jgi:hypothetical protein